MLRLDTLKQSLRPFHNAAAQSGICALKDAAQIEK